MKLFYFTICLCVAAKAADTLLLDEVAVKNLRLETLVVEERDFESTVFAVGRVEEIPGNRWSVSSRIPGRAVEVNAFFGDTVREGEVLARVESRQPGNPPPTIELRAPHDGLITESHVLKGQPVEPDKDLLDISDRSEMWVVAQIPEQLAAGIAPGTRARIHFPALGGEPVEAELRRFGVQANRDAGSVEGVFQVSNADGRLLPGMRAEFEIVVSTRPGVLAIPEEAVQGDPASRVVFVKDFDLPNAYQRVPVVLGEKGGGWVEVEQGVFPGDEVVTRGSYSLGFVGGSSGMSLKEALDAAHGHQHNEDGSEMTADQKAAHEDHDHEEGHADKAGGAPAWVIGYAVVSTLLTLLFGQLWWNSKRKEN
ncbi:multidrug efflux pump subunit AcrA (membrane-fusion protein) [Haloferula luteola]|uniref:Multidrug efflux pump subunit AcrA (Membrane-fusion protein) n=1 Tax=Haloferula luteola TaxID=595692 RepID=A0A840V800_9BACT|nr:efflux RND transporter periplasmic adaptor subunit [Haloferula luteola]MBB5350858.1 multidrug efflux pump subunit AcrA (membrane-fusion protein) [Haloferula luteola]